MSRLSLLALTLTFVPAFAPLPAQSGEYFSRHDQPVIVCNGTRGTQRSIHETNSSRRMLTIDPSGCLDVRSEGPVGFSDDDSDVVSLSSGGFLAITEIRGGVTRHMTFDERGGRIVRRYTENGSERDESSAGSWLRTVLPQVARESSIGAEARAARIMRQRGPSGLIAEMEAISSESVKEKYMELFLSDSRVGPSELRMVAARVPTLFSSDSKRNAVLTSLLARAGRDPAIVDAVIGSTREISSDRQRGAVLKEAIGRGTMSQSSMLAALRSISGISSDRERANALIELASRQSVMTDSVVRRAFLDSIKGISSSSEYRRVMESVVR
jgi:hypothetical protein